MMKALFLAVAVVAVQARDHLRTHSVLQALSSQVKTIKCTDDEVKEASATDPCKQCGCDSCPCCTSGGTTCPPDDSVTCSSLTDVSNNGADPVACANALFPGAEKCQNLDSDGDGYVSMSECNDVTGNGGNLCFWYSYTAPDNAFTGSCEYNPCSNINDGSCTLQKTGGRCVWYGNPNNLRQILNTVTGSYEKEAANPYQQTSGCYRSPCNNPSGYNRAVGSKNEGDVRANNPRGCESENDKNPYKCQWCSSRTTTQNMVMGCQNVKPTSVARPSRIANTPEQGEAPCGNYYCNFYKFENTTVKNFATPTARTNSATIKCEGDDGDTFDWNEVYGDGTADTTCSCPANYNAMADQKTQVKCPETKSRKDGSWNPTNLPCIATCTYANGTSVN